MFFSLAMLNHNMQQTHIFNVRGRLAPGLLFPQYFELTIRAFIFFISIGSAVFYFSPSITLSQVTPKQQLSPYLFEDSE